MKDQALWEGIKTHPMPDGFVGALRERTGWPRDRAEAAIVEYRRLAYLVGLVKSARRVPSRPVEEVWRLHAEQADNYDRFCREVLGRGWTPPNDGVARRNGRDMDLTRKAYTREFGVAPPARIWPDPNRVVRLGLAGGFAAAGAAGSLAAASIGPVIAGGVLAALILLLRGKNGAGQDDDGAMWGVMAAGDGGFDGGGDAGGCD